MLIPGFSNRQTRNNDDIKNIRFSINQMLGEPSQHADMSSVIKKMILAVSKSRGDFGR